MGDKTGIEWTGSTWTPIRARYMEIQNDGSGKERIGWHCEHVSEGCRNCYAEAINRRVGTRRDFKPGEPFRQDRGGYNNGDTQLFLDVDMLNQPLRWKKPRRIFVCSMTDLFADFVTDEWIDLMFCVMALASRHTFQVLTKRPERMRRYMVEPLRKRAIARWSMSISNELAEKYGWKRRPTLDHFSACFAGSEPFANVWLGTSVEDQPAADERIPALLATPSAVRFISAEPLLGPVDLTAVKRRMAEGYARPLDGRFNKIDWVIAGGESGPGARPMHPDWARSLRDQCAAAAVPFFFKQWGEWAFDPRVGRKEMRGDDQRHPIDESWSMIRLGKRGAGRLLDGREHSEFPTPAAPKNQLSAQPT